MAASWTRGDPEMFARRQTACHPAEPFVTSARVHPIAFHLGNLPVTWYGLLVMTGFVAGLWTASRRGLLCGVSPQQVWDAGTWLIIATIVGARTLYVASYWNEEFAGRPWVDVFKVYQGGLVFYGGLIGCVVATIIFTRVQKIPLWRFADVLAPSISLGYVFGRIGCLMNGCCFGRACDVPWAVHYPADHHTHGAGVHPTQVYDSLLNLLFYLALAWLFRRKKFDGQIFALWLMGYAMLRSLVESYRGDYPVRYLGGVFTPAQLISLAVFTAGAALYLAQRRTAAKTA